MISILPVRSPLPSKVPSIRSAPASTPSSAAATAQPRSLCVCKLTVTCSRLAIWRQKYSTWSANTFGVDASTVAGKFKITSWPFSGCQTSQTASQTSTAYSVSVWLKLSGEYWNTHSVSGYLAAYSTNKLAPAMAISLISALSLAYTFSRCTRLVEL